MGFYGNTIYNTYGLQDKSVQPRHLDRNYWRWGRKIATQSIQALRKKVLNLPAIGIDNFTEQNWESCWAEAEKSVFAFHFAYDKKDDSQKDYSAELRALFGAGLNIGWVIKETSSSSSIYALYFMALGTQKRGNINRPGSIFRLELNPNGYTEDEQLVDYANYKDSCEPSWSNKYLVGPVLSDAHLLKNSVIEEKIKNDAVTTDKIKDLNVTTEKINNQAITPEKLKREHLEKVELWSTISTWTDFCNQVDFIGTDNTEAAPGGSLYFVLEINAPMPPLYSNLLNQKIERGLAWAASGDNHFVLDCQNGRLWRIIKNSGNSGDNNVVPENGINYKIILQQIITEQVTDRAITPNKLDRDYLEKICLSNINGYDALFDQIKNINTSTTSSNNPNESSTVYLVQNILLESLPNLYLNEDSGYYLPSNSSITGYPYVLGRSIVWRLTDTIYIISNTTGYTWKIDKVARTSTGTQIIDTGNINCKYSITLNTIPGNLIENESISTIKIADNAITRNKILNKEIVGEKIADHSIAPNHLTETYIRGFHAPGEPETTAEAFIQEGLVKRGDLYINDNTGYVYCFKGYNPSMGRYEWVPVQSGPKSYLEGKRSLLNSRPSQGNIGDIWVDSDTGRIWIYKQYGVENQSRWEELKSYQIENKDIKDKTITASKLAPGTIQSFLLNNVLLAIPCADPEVGLTEEDVEQFILNNFTNADYPLFVISYGKEGDKCLLGYNINHHEGGAKYNSLDCIDLIEKTICRLSINHNPSRQHPIDRINLEAMGRINMLTKPQSPSLGALFYNADEKCLEVFDGEKWNYIYGYNQTNVSTVAEE